MKVAWIAFVVGYAVCLLLERLVFRKLRGKPVSVGRNRRLS
jgi:hypothetical protein